MSVLLPWPVNTLPPLRPGDDMRESALDPARRWEWECEGCSPPNIDSFDAWLRFIRENPSGFLAPNGYTGSHFTMTSSGILCLEIARGRINGPNPWDHFRVTRTAYPPGPIPVDELYALFEQAEERQYRMAETPAEAEFSRRWNNDRRALESLVRSLGWMPMGEYSDVVGSSGWQRDVIDTLDAVISNGRMSPERDLTPRECQWVRDLLRLLDQCEPADRQKIEGVMRMQLGHEFMDAFACLLYSSTDVDTAAAYDRGVMVL